CHRSHSPAAGPPRSVDPQGSGPAGWPGPGSPLRPGQRGTRPGCPPSPERRSRWSLLLVLFVRPELFLGHGDAAKLVAAPADLGDRSLQLGRGALERDLELRELGVDVVLGLQADLPSHLPGLLE